MLQIGESAGYVLDPKRRVFIADNCYDDTIKHLARIFQRHRIPKENIFKGLDLLLVRTGDYLVRRIGDDFAIYEIEDRHSIIITKKIAEL